MIEHDLTPRDVLTLQRLNKKNNKPLRAYTCSHVSSVNLTAIIDKLTGRGLAMRITNPKDRRSYLLTITNNGKQIITK